MPVDVKGLGKAQKEFQKKYKRKIIFNSLIQFAISCAVFVIGIIFILFAGIGVYQVSGNGMGNELKDGSYSLGNKFAYIINNPSRGDVVVTKGSSVYRIIGMPGETVEFNGGFVYVNGKVLDESAYLNTDGKSLSTVYSKETYVVPENSYFVLCDNRDCFEDSREKGLFITKDNIESKMFFTF